MTDRGKIIDRVVKMLALATSNTSAAEAALAADRAGKLMDEYEIQDAELRVLEPSKCGEPIEKRYIVECTRAKKRVSWVATLAWAVTGRFGCRWYYTGGGTVTMFGRQSACQAAAYTMEYLHREVAALADAAEVPYEASSQRERSVRSWKNSFRMGAATEIASRLREATPTRPARAKVVVEDHAPESRSHALVLVERDRAEVDAAYADFSKSWRKSSGGGGGGYMVGSGFSAGRAAGQRVSLGGARASLGRGPGRLS